MNRLAETFQRLRTRGDTGLVAYVTAGDPDLPRSRKIINAVGRAGADVLEIGVPFSDPVADGPAIQRASERALAAGSHLSAALDLVAEVRAELAPAVVLFTYVNPVLRLGLDRFVARAAEAGVDGVLLLDVPIEEAADVRARLDAKGIDQIFLISPTTSDARLAEAARLGRGFLYAISRLGVTGARDAVAGTARPLVARIRAATTMPIALGFGISRPEHVTEVGEFADAAVVGSALVQVIAEASSNGGDPATRAGDFIRWLKGSSQADTVGSAGLVS
jgi:tryptophan synthase alpha chain